MKLGKWFDIDYKEEERVERNDDYSGGDTASLQSTFVRIAKGGPSCRLIEPCPRRGPQTAESQLWPGVPVCRPPPANPAVVQSGNHMSSKDQCLRLFPLTF